jgi:hypothetical protein
MIGEALKADGRIQAMLIERCDPPRPSYSDFGAVHVTTLWREREQRQPGAETSFCAGGRKCPCSHKLMKYGREKHNLGKKWCFETEL